jgi:hypothetical protein
MSFYLTIRLVKVRRWSAMARHIKYSDAERQLAGLAREVAMNWDVLYHGTRYAQSILKTRSYSIP